MAVETATSTNKVFPKWWRSAHDEHIQTALNNALRRMSKSSYYDEVIAQVHSTMIWKFRSQLEGKLTVDFLVQRMAALKISLPNYIKIRDQKVQPTVSVPAPVTPAAATPVNDNRLDKLVEEIKTLNSKLDALQSFNGIRSMLEEIQAGISLQSEMLCELAKRVDNLTVETDNVCQPVQIEVQPPVRINSVTVLPPVKEKDPQLPKADDFVSVFEYADYCKGPLWDKLSKQSLTSYEQGWVKLYSALWQKWQRENMAYTDVPAIQVYGHTPAIQAVQAMFYRLGVKRIFWIDTTDVPTNRRHACVNKIVPRRGNLAVLVSAAAIGMMDDARSLCTQHEIKYYRTVGRTVDTNAIASHFTSQFAADAALLEQNKTHKLNGVH